MFVKNTTKEDIGPVIAQEGFEFIIPASSVCAITEEAGKHLLSIYKIEDKNSYTLPPIIEAGRDDWDGKTYAIVTRYQINPKLIPNRTDLIKIATARGVEKELVEKFEKDANVDNEDIVIAINKLPVPENVRFPETSDKFGSTEIE